MAKKKYIDNPDKLWKWFEEYRNEVKETPRIRIEFHGKDAHRCEVPMESPLIIEGFKSFCRAKGCDINRYWYNHDKDCDEFVSIVTRIRDIIRNDQISGGMVGQYNSTLTARLNGLKEQSETINTTEVKILNFDPLDDSQDKIE